MTSAKGQVSRDREGEIQKRRWAGRIRTFFIFCFTYGLFLIVTAKIINLTPYICII